MADRLPAALVARARQLAEGTWTPPTAAPAATVVLMRDTAGGPEVLLLLRPRSMGFAPGMHVFPGGRVDLPGDAQVPVVGTPGVGTPGEADWAGTSDLARAVHVAAVRETFEEAGVLIAVDARGRTPRPDPEWAQDREGARQPDGLSAVLGRRGLHIDADLLVPVAHWVTPEVETRRFDVRFLAAALPDGQQALAHEGETDGGLWIAPDTALGRYRAGELPMLPPTVAVLTDLLAHPTVASVTAWARARVPVPHLPRPSVTPSGVSWDLVHAYTGAVLRPTTEPAGSEVLGDSGESA